MSPSEIIHCFLIIIIFPHQKYVKYVRNLLSITSCGEHCVLATRADDSSGQVTDRNIKLSSLIGIHFF